MPIMFSAWPRNLNKLLTLTKQLKICRVKRTSRDAWIITSKFLLRSAFSANSRFKSLWKTRQHLEMNPLKMRKMWSKNPPQMSKNEPPLWNLRTRGSILMAIIWQWFKYLDAARWFLIIQSRCSVEETLCANFTDVLLQGISVRGWQWKTQSLFSEGAYLDTGHGIHRQCI